MDFDFKHITAPFRMRPGLSRLDADARHLTRLDRSSALYREKSLVCVSGGALHCVAGFDPSDALRAIDQNALAHEDGPPPGPQPAIGLAFEEDLVLLDAESGTAPWMCVCVPSRWAPEDKLGKSLAAIHAPVADNGKLSAASPHLTRLVTSGGHWERFVWTVSPSKLHDQHPHRHPASPWPSKHDPVEFASGCYLRAERQTFLPVCDRHGEPKAQAVFTIRVMVEPLVSAVRGSADAERLYTALDSMTNEVVSYKNLATARAPLLAWLSTLMTGQPENA